MREKNHFSKLVKEVMQGKEIIISKGNKPEAKIISLEQRKKNRKLDTAIGMISIAPDFDKPLRDFRDYMQ